MDDRAKQWETTYAQIAASGVRRRMIADGNPPMIGEQLDQMYLTLAPDTGHLGEATDRQTASRLKTWTMALPSAYRSHSPRR
jgi:hypothetical protein